MSGSPVVPVPGSDQPLCDLTDLGGGYLRRVIGRAEPDRVQRQRPRRPARLQRHTSEYGQPGIICAFPFPRA